MRALLKEVCYKEKFIQNEQRMRRETWKRGNKEDRMGTALMGSIK